LSNISRGDYRSLQETVDAVPDGSDSSIFIPAGIWNEPEKVIIPETKHISLIGSGADISILRWTIRDGGLSVRSMGMPQRTFVVKDISFETTVENGGNAIETHHVDANASLWRTLFFSGVTVRPVTGSGPAFWNNGFVLTNAWNAHLEGLHCVGENGNFKTSNGILLKGKSVDVHVLGFHAYYVDSAISVDPCHGCISEGLNVTAGKIVAVNTGINIPLGGAGLTLVGIHIAAEKCGVFLVNRDDPEIFGLTIHKREARDNFIGIDLQGTSNARIQGNMIHVASGGGGNGKNGIVISDGVYSIISGNVMHGMDTGIWLKSAAEDSIIVNNLGVGCGQLVLNQGSRNHVNDNVSR
jgi:hypothetical protein